ncbi:MAG TPA: S8 family serine peptidase, partial [Saprospiraceae bacterium]|nr:S8 family serine peptidase [Saprospiraceae bacterium]
MKPITPLRLLLSLAWLCLFPALNAQTPDTARTDYRIRINTYVFDPLQNMPTIENRLKSVGSEGDSVYRLIQFKHALLRADMDLLRKEFGLKLDQYFPNYTYLEKVSRQQLSALSRLPVFRWTGNYEPAYKISPAAGKGNFVTKERQAQRGLIINLNLHRGANAKLFGEQLRKDGIQVLRVFDQTPKQPNGRVRVRVSGTADLSKLAAYPEVKWIEEEGDITIDAADGLVPYNGGVQGIIQSNGAATPLYNNGIRGEGQVVGLIDAPLDMNHCFFTDGAVANPGPTHRKVVGFRQVTASPFAAAANCNSGHGTHTAGTVAGNSAGNANNGIAFNAKLTYGDLNDVAFSNGGGTRTFAQYLDEARSDGAFVHSNSWSDKNSAVQNAYTALSQDLDDFTWNDEDQLVVVSSGNNIDTNNDGNNDSPSPIRPPFSSKNGLCVAASSEANTNNIATGGVGPTFDNRRKPEIYAPGSNTTSSQAGTNCTTFACGGSSMATPAVAASGALVRQYFTEGWYPSGTKRPDHAFTPSGALLKATLLNATRNMTGTDAFGVAANVNGYPTNLEGWGELVLDDALYFAGDARNTWVWDVRHDGGLNTGETNTYFLPVATNTQPLKVTLTWMEPPAASANFGAPVVNDVNLRVTAPDGTTVFLGNNFNAGQSATGGAFDGVNNVEMVLVNTPQTGTWRIEVIGTAINQGNPSQGYALVATADTQEPPSPTGVQNTLVLRAAMPGTTPAGAPGLANCQNLMTNINTYISEVSYGQTTIVPVFRQVTLTTPLGTYLSNDHNPLIEMAEDAIDNIVAAEPGIFDQGPGTADDISRIVILLNDQGFTGDWATTGPWPYSLPAGLTRPLSVSVTSANTNINPQFRLEHAVCHQLGLMDLYPHPGVAFAQPHVDNWDIMANQNEVQPLGWSKEKALWMSTHSAASIRWIPRPAAGIAFDQEIPLNFLSSTNTASPRVIAIGQTPGVTSMANENVFFFVEARSNAAGSVDSRLPESGVLLYTVNENIRQGEGPVQIIDQVVSTDLDDAALEANGQAHNLSGSYGLTVTRRAPTGGENVRVRIQYDPPETDNDVNIVVGDPFWISPDIWVDSQEDGFDTDNGNTPADRGNSPVAGETNRIYFTVHNPGPGTAFDVTVAVRISEPYHTIGGDADFNRFVAQKFYA